MHCGKKIGDLHISINSVKNPYCLEYNASSEGDPKDPKDPKDLKDLLTQFSKFNNFLGVC